ncbi:hypothetical protein MKX03_022750 [Papaver bracteatum]|nr:hypothetical protein MKX03_022750 [Papaver bracteatum]
MVNKMKRKSRGENIYESDRLQQKTQQTFVLAYPCHYSHRSVGAILTKFENYRCMDVTRNFAQKHVYNIGWDPEAYEDNVPYGNWVNYIASNPVVAMIVEGKGAMDKVHELISEKQLPFWCYEEATVYTSSSPAQAKIDIGTWFRSIDLEKEMRNSKKVVSVLPDNVHGPVHDVEQTFQNIYEDVTKLPPKYKDWFSMEEMCVLLINPLAFQRCCAGQVLDAIQANCSSIRGIKLVRKADYPSNLWPTHSVSSDYGIAVVVCEIKPSLTIMSKDPYGKYINYTKGVFRIGSNYIHQSEPGKEVLEHATKFFKSGFSVWKYLNGLDLGGYIFEASLVGLVE